MDGDEITPIEKFAVTITDTNHQNNHTWGFPVYVLDSILQCNKYGLPKWEPWSCTRIYIVHSPFHVGSVALVLSPASVHVSPQFHVVFDDDFSTVPFIREVKIPPKWIDLVQCRSQSGAPENIDLRDTLSTPDLEEYTRKLQVTSWSSLQRIIIRHPRRHSPKLTYKRVHPARERLHLNCTNV